MTYLHLTALNNIYKYELDNAIQNINNKLINTEWYIKYERDDITYYKYFLSFESRINRLVRYLAFRINNKQYDNSNTIVNNQYTCYKDMADNFLIIEKLRDNFSRGVIIAERDGDIDGKTYRYLNNILKTELYKIGIILKNKKIIGQYSKLNDLTRQKLKVES